MNSTNYGSVTYTQTVFDRTRIAIAALLLRLSIARSLKITLGIDDNSTDSIAYASTVSNAISDVACK